MASSRKPNKAKRQRSRTHIKKHLLQHRNITSLDQASPCSVSPTTTTTTCSSSSSTSGFKDANLDDDNPPSSPPTGGCCTPKAHKYRIPEMLTCPPAPRKQRVLSNCTLRRRPIAFFAPPDIELFFVFARGEQVN